MITTADLDRVTFVTLTFTTQKNCVQGEVIGLGLSGNPFVCPVLCVARRVKHLRQHNARDVTPLCPYYAAHKAHYVTSSNITVTLQASVRALGSSIGFHYKEVSACSLPPRRGSHGPALCPRRLRHHHC
jgi:hypothetical protein